MSRSLLVNVLRQAFGASAGHRIAEHHGQATARQVLDRQAEYTQSVCALEERLIQHIGAHFSNARRQ